MVENKEHIFYGSQCRYNNTYGLLAGAGFRMTSNVDFDKLNTSTASRAPRKV